MADKTITAANSVFILNVRGLITAQLQGYSADAAFETDASTPMEVMKGVDGRMSAGFVPFLTTQTINLQADSDSVLVFENWLATMKSVQEVIYADATISLPSVKRKYACTKGVLSQANPIPGTRKTMQPRAFQITWDTIDPAPF